MSAHRFACLVLLSIVAAACSTGSPGRGGGGGGASGAAEAFCANAANATCANAFRCNPATARHGGNSYTSQTVCVAAERQACQDGIAKLQIQDASCVPPAANLDLCAKSLLDLPCDTGAWDSPTCESLVEGFVIACVAEGDTSGSDIGSGDDAGRAVADAAALDAAHTADTGSGGADTGSGTADTGKGGADTGKGGADTGTQDGSAAGTPKLVLTPAPLKFDQVKPGTSATKGVSLSNVGTAALIVSKLSFVADNNFTLVVDTGGTVKEHKPNGAPIQFAPPLAVAPGASVAMKVKFAAKDDAQRQGTVVVHSNDATAAASGANKLIITANAHLACMKLEPSGKLDFGGIKLGVPTERQVTIRNCGGVDLIVTAVDFDAVGTNSSEFALSFTAMAAKYPQIDATKGPSKAQPLAIKVNSTATVGVIYTPSDESPIDPATKQPKPDIGTIKVTSNAYSAKDSVVCEGIGVTKICSTAKISVKEGEEVVPQTMLHLKGDGSKATGGGQVKKYLWTVKQPAGSKQKLVPSAAFPNPTFVANAAGEYEFCLDVWDQNDVKSCSPACDTVLVLPEEAIHVELLWDTPADKNQTDTGPKAGADLDLHFAHALAAGPDIDCDGQPDPWFSNPFDTFWFNPNPNWGSANPAVNDDPSLDLDDTDGAGPENLNLDDPEGKVAKPVKYAVGAHYWNDHGFKTSFATVNIYIMGVLALQIAKVELNVLDMWYVGRINWPNTMSSGTLDPFLVCFQSGDPCKGGKRWLSKGDYCITPCYVNASFTATQSGAKPSACAKP